MNISEVAKLVGLSSKQIRDYEKCGLLKPAQRSQHRKARPRSWSTALGQGLPPAERNKGPQWFPRGLREP